MIKLPTSALYSLKGVEIALIKDGDSNVSSIAGVHAALQKLEAHLSVISLRDLGAEELRCFDVLLIGIRGLSIDQIYDAKANFRPAIPFIALDCEPTDLKSSLKSHGIEVFHSSDISIESMYDMITASIGSKKVALLNKIYEDEPLYDTTKLYEISRGNENFIESMVKLFMETTPENTEKLKLACKDKDVASISRIVHTMKPSLEMLNIRSLQPVIRNIEEQAKLKDLESIEFNVCYLVRVLDKVIADLRRAA